MDNTHTGWRQGRFVDQRQYDNRSDIWKDKCRIEEKLKVRPSPFGNAICSCDNPDTAKWIAERLNIAAKLERKSQEPKEAKAASDKLSMKFPKFEEAEREFVEWHSENGDSGITIGDLRRKFYDIIVGNKNK